MQKNQLDIEVRMSSYLTFTFRRSFYKAGSVRLALTQSLLRKL